MDLNRQNLLSFIFLLSMMLFTVHGGAEPQIPDSILAKIEHLDAKRQIQHLTDISWQIRESNHALAIELNRKAIQQANKLRYYNEEAKALNMQGSMLLNYHSDIKQAHSCFDQALALATSIADSVQIAYAYNNLGDVYKITGNTPLALAFADSSLHYFSQLNHALGISYSYINLAEAYIQQKNYQKALKAYQKAINLYVLHESRSIISTCNIGIANIHQLSGDYEKALAFYEQDLILNRETGNKLFEANTLTRIGEILYKQGKLDKATSCFDKALNLFHERGHQSGTIDAHIGKALIFAQNQQEQEGLKELNIAMNTAQNLGIASLIINVQKAKLIFYTSLFKNPIPDKLINTFIEVYDSILLSSQQQTFNEIEERQQLQNNLLNISNEYNKKKRQSFYALSLSLIFLSLLLLLFLKYRAHERLSRKLKAANAGKDRLLSIISHDLRNPFIAIMQYLDLLREDMLPEQERQNFIKQLEALTNNTYALLENLLIFSDFRRSEIQFTPAIFDLHSLINQIHSNLEAQLSIKNVELKTALGTTSAYGDVRLIEIILRNLISNAIKYSYPGKQVLVFSEENDKEIIIGVRDSGMGMNKETLNRLSTNKFTNSNLGTGNETGTGIGLKICSEFIALHKGWMTIESQPGQGATFRVHLPQE